MPTREELQNKYSTILSGGNNARLRASVRGVIDRSPDQSAEVINLSQRTGLPGPLVERNRDSVARRSKVDRYSDLLKTNPRLGAFMSEPENASVAHDDIENLSGLEWVFKAFRGAHREQWETIELGRLRSQQLSGQLSDQQRARVEELSEQQRGGEFGAEGWWENVVVETGRLLPTMEAALGGGIEKAALYGGGFAGAALIAGQAGPQLLTPEEVVTVPGAALMGMGFGMAAGAAEEVYNLEAGLAYDEFLQMEGVGGEAIDDRVARAAASMVGAVNAGLELVGFGAVARTIPGINRLKSSIGRTAVKEALKQPTFRNALMRFAGSYAGAMGTEVTTEILQEASTILGGELAGQLSAGEFQSLSPEEMGTRLAEIAVKTTQGMTVLAGVGPSVQLASDARNAQRARQNQQVFQALGEHAENSKLRQRLPEKFRQYVERLKEGGDIDAVRVPVEAFDEYFQSEGLNPRDVYQEVTGNPNGYDEAQAAGTDISIPIDRYAAQLAGTRHHEALMPNLRLRPDDMTMREAEAWQAQSEQILEELSAGLEPATESSRVVYDDVMGQLLQTGMEQGAAEQNAQLMASVFDTLAQRTGTTAEVLYERYGLRIQREMPEVLRSLRKVDLDVDPLIDRLRAGEVPTDREIYGESLSEFLRERGGLQDQGGELAARDVQKSIRGLVKPEGMSFDAAAELAQESGYITERSEQALLDAIGREISGEGAFRPDAANQQLLDLRMALDDLDNYLGQQGVDLQSVGNEDIRQLLQGTVFDQPAYHGSPHRFDRFSLERIGTGEGAQAYGWGLYFAENKGVAESYARELSDSATSDIVEITVNGESVPLNTPEAHAAKLIAEGGAPKREIVSSARAWLEEARTDKTSSTYLAFSDFGREIGIDGEQYAQRLLAQAQAITKRDVKLRRSEGQVYEVEIADEHVDRMLDWDASVSEQPQNVRDALRRATSLSDETIEYWKGVLAEDLAENGPGGYSDSRLERVIDEVVEFGEYGPEFGTNAYDELREAAPERAEEFIDVIDRQGGGGIDPDADTGQQIYRMLESSLGSAKAASDRLREAGVPGIKYFDQVSRGTGEGTRNIVVFDESLVTIKTVNGEPVTAEQAQEFFQSSRPQTETEEFKRWFGDSKMVGENGEPMVVYHGSAAADLQSFDVSRAGTVQRGDWGKGIYFSPERGSAEYYATEAMSETQDPEGERLFAEYEQRAREMGTRPMHEAIDLGFGSAQYNELKKVFERWREHKEQFRKENPGTVYPAYLKIERPMIYQYVGITEPNLDEIAKNEGYDGILVVHEQAADESFTDTIEEIVVFEPEQVKSATGNAGTFDAESSNIFEQRFDETRRGSIQFGRDRQFNINLLRTADLSTVLHESGHFYLEILGDLAEEDGSPAQVTQDYAAILKWLGVENRQAIGTEQHEQFARGFEAYLMEGNAPSIELQTAFARFRAWLVSLYRQLKALNVTLTDEVRGVFDRMVATDDAIETAEQSQNYVALFTDAETAGMSPEQWNAYRRVAQDAWIEAEDKLSRQLMDVMRREQLKWWREQKDRVRGEVSGEIHRMPVYQALSFLSRGTNPDGSAVEGVTPVKLSKSILMEEYGLPQEFLNKLPGHGPRSIYSTKEGVHPDFVAPMFGYSSGRAMIEALASARPMRELIAAETDARMSEQYPDPLTDGSLADRAINAVHSDKRAELLSAELRALRRKRAEVQPFVRAAERQAARERRESREANRASIPRGDDLRVIKAAAERIIGQKVIRDIQPHSYRVAEAKAARKAFDAAGRGDFETAYFEKRKEILNHELYRSATKGMERAEKARTYFKKFGKKRTRERIGKAGGEYLENIDAMLADFSLGRTSGAAIDRVKAKRHILDQINAGEIVADQETIRALEQEAVKNWRELPLDAFVGLQDTIRQIEHEARMLSEAIVNGERVALREIATEIGTAIRESGKESPLERGQPSQAETRKETPLSMESAWLRPGNTARILDGREWGPTTRYLVSMLRQATVNRLLPWLHADYENFNALYDKHYSNKELRQFHDKDFFEGLSRSDVISMALYRGNATSWRALIEGVDRKQADAAVYPQAFVERAMSRLDSRDYAFVEDLWQHFNSYWTEFAAAEKRRRGIAPEKIEATPYTVVTSDGATLTVSGGYVPNSYDSRYDSSKRVEDIDFFQKMQTGSIVTASTRAGASHERVGSGKRVLALGLERMQRSHQEVIRDVAIGDEVNFVRRILTSDEVVSAARDTGQMEKIKALDTWLRDSATGEVPATHGIEKWLRMFRTNFIASKIGISLTTTFLQPTGAFPSMAILGRQAFGSGLGRYMSDPKRWHDWMMEKSAFMRARYQLDTVNKDIQDASAAVGIGSSALPTTFHRWHQNAKSWMFAPIKAFQLPVDSATFLGAYWKGEQMGLTGDDLVAYADARVEEAQTSGLFVDRSNFERGSIGNVKQSQFLRMWSTLIGYMLAQTNNMYERGVQFKRRQTLKNAITAGVFFGQVYILQTLVEAFIRGQWPDDDDDESFTWWTTKRAAENVVSGVPFLREYQSFGYGAGGDTPITSWLSDVYKAQEQLAQGEIDEPLTKNVINAIGGITGAPSTQINRAVDAHFAEREGENVEFYEYLTGHRE